MFPNPGRNTAGVFSRIEADLRNMYVLGFAPPAGDARRRIPSTHGDHRSPRAGGALPSRLPGAKSFELTVTVFYTDTYKET